MKHREIRLLRSLRAAQAFATAHAHRMPHVARSGVRTRLDDLLTTVAAHADRQAANDVSARMATCTYRAMRAALIRDHMLPIVKIAALEEADSPEMSALRLPPRWATPERLHADALAMAETAARSAHRFTAAGLPPDFAEQLTAAAHAMLAAAGTKTGRRLARGQATAGVRLTIAAARRTLAALDAMVVSAIHGDESLLTAWKSAIRPERRRRRASAAIAAAAAPAAESPGVALVAIDASTAAIESTVPTAAEPARLPAAEQPVRWLSDGLMGALVRMLPGTRVSNRQPSGDRVGESSSLAP